MIHANSSETSPAPVLVIMGSVRASRHNETIARWMIDTARASRDLDYELVDLRDWHLPMDDEPGIPALGVYAQDHSQAWSRKVAQARAIIFVTPQYNWGYPAALKNAIDHLYKEWAGKPAMIVTYGGHGGDKCAAQLRQVALSVKMRVAGTMPEITLSRFMIEGGPIAPESDFAGYAPSIAAAITELAAMIEG